MGLPEEGLLLEESRTSSFVREGMKALGVSTDITKTKMGTSALNVAVPLNKRLRFVSACVLKPVL